MRLSSYGQDELVATWGMVPGRVLSHQLTFTVIAHVGSGQDLAGRVGHE